MTVALLALHRRAAAAAFTLALALAACSPSLSLPPGAKITCSSTADCPQGLVCQLDRCQDPANLDTTPPDLVGAVAVDPLRGRSGDTFTVRFEATEPLAAEPRVSLGVTPPADLPCVPGTGNAHVCTYVATGGENRGTGGNAGIDVRLRDLAGNETVRGNVAVLTLDYAPPGVAVASVSYLPAASNPLPFVARATVGTRVRVAVSAAERLSTTATPALTAPSAPSLTFALVPGSLDATGAVLEATVPAGLADGTYALRVSWEDEVGNSGTADLPASASVQVKTSVPALQVDQAKLVFLRSPQGNAAVESLGGHTLPAGPYFAVEPDDTLSPSATLPSGSLLLAGGATPTRVVVQASGGSSPLVLGVLAPDGSGLFPRQQLVSVDAPGGWLVGVDDAGNRSVAVKLTYAEWVASTNPPAFGTSPHSLTWSPGGQPVPIPDGLGYPALGAAAAGADGTAFLARSALAWDQRLVRGPPPARYSAPMAYDAGRGRIVVFSGSAWSGATRTDTWEWDGAAWHDVTPVLANPGNRFGQCMAYDSARGRVTLVGGVYNKADVWEWDGTKWTDVTPAGTSPPARVGQSLAFDAYRGRLVLFGGTIIGVGNVNDTWEYDGTSWTQKTPATSPPFQSGGRMVYDPYRRRVVLIANSSGSADVWEWDGTSWTRLTATGTVMPARDNFGIAYDTARRRVVVFGGQSTMSGYLRDLWEWDGSAWANLTPASGHPSTRFNLTMAHDPVRGETVLFSGIPGTGDLNDTWTWNGSLFKDRSSNGLQPPARSNTNVSYDPSRGRTVLFGGWSQASQARVGDTWEWDGTVWRSFAPASSPSARDNPNVSFDTLRGRTVLFGGVNAGLTYLNDVWEWNGTTWLSTAPATALPTSRYSQAQAYDGARQRTLIFGGQSSSSGVLQDLWQWDGTGWTNVTPSGTKPTPRTGTPGAFDTSRGRWVVFGGSAGGALVQDTWEWNGSAWAQITPAGALPPARYVHAGAYDSFRARVVIAGGAGNGNPLADVWEWNGTAWRDVTPPGIGPSPFTMAYDSARKRMVAYDGTRPWELVSDDTRRPAVQLDVAARQAGFPVASVTGMRVRACAGATATAGASGVGAELVGWSGYAGNTGTGWQALGTNSTGLAASQPYLGAPSTTLIDWTAPTVLDATRLFQQRDLALAFQVRPRGTSGTDALGAAVALDYLEVRIRYAAP